MIAITPDDFYRIVVGVDPSVTSGQNADETGIIVAASGPHQPSTCSIETCNAHAYVLQDATLTRSNKNSVDKWLDRVIEVYDAWNASLVVVEDNQGRELLEMSLRTKRPDLPIVRPNARENKKARAEPIVALYEQGRVHHVGDPSKFALLEEQMTTWIPGESGRGRVSPDRVDALVWAIAELNLQGSRLRKRTPIVDPVGIMSRNVWSI
jgi:phage terminase large subunit-like protein